MFKIMCFDQNDNLSIIGRNGTPFTFESEEAAYNQIIEIQNMPNRPNFKLMWTRRYENVDHQHDGSGYPDYS